MVRQVPQPDARGNSPLAHVVHQKLSTDELWNIKSVNDLWICPYCLSAIAKRPGLTHPEAIARHLENCRSFALGKGIPQPRERVLDRRTYENIVHSAQQDPAWRVYDVDGIWISPFSLQRVPSVRPQQGKLDNFVLQALARHLSTCPFHRQGIIHRVDEVVLARELLGRMPEVARYVDYQLHTTSGWRFVNAHGSWICPFTLHAIDQVRITSAESWLSATSPIVHHLISNCPRFATGQIAPNLDSTVQQAAGAGGRCLPPPNSATPSPVSQTQILGTTTRTRLTILTPTPQGQQATGSVATPTVHHSTTYIRTPKAISPSAGRTDGFLFSRTPLPGPLETIQGTRRLTPVPELNADTRQLAPLSVHQLPPLKPNALTPIAAPPPIAGPPPLALPLSDTPVTGVPAATRINALHHAQDADESHFDWMDEADAGAQTHVAEAGPSTDMIQAKRLQQTMLQQAPAVPGYQFATCFEPCTDISGDFFVFIKIPGERIGIALGDVSGHGVQAGLIMSMAKKTLEIYAAQGLGPAETLSRVNDALVADLGGKMFISMVYGVLDPTEQTLTWARAGHNPTLRYNILSATSSEIKPRGMVVGMKTGAVFRNSLDEEITFVQSGDVFLLYTDGITETMNLQNDEFGAERLTEVVIQCADDGPAQVVSQVMERLRHFRGPRPPADDATMVAILVE